MQHNENCQVNSKMYRVGLPVNCIPLIMLVVNSISLLIRPYLFEKLLLRFFPQQYGSVGQQKKKNQLVQIYPFSLLNR